MLPKELDFLKDINIYKPGKSKISKDNTKKIIKLSSNENALGSSKLAIKGYKKHSTDLLRYASGDCLELRKSLARTNNINENNILCGAGSDEVISMITQTFCQKDDEVIYSEHGFLMYPIAAKKVGAKAVKAKETELKANIDNILKLINKKTKVIFIANPNNPTGSYLNKSEINKLIQNTPKNILIVLDHAYDEFVDKNDYPNALELAKKHQNIIVTRTFSKIYGLASLRIGWCFADINIINSLNKVRGPFNVSGPAQISAIEALKDQNFIKKSKLHNDKWLNIYYQELAKIENVKFYKSQGNFILIEFENSEKAKKVNDELLESAIIVREMTAYSLPKCLRVSIGSDKENKIFLKTLKKLVTNK